MRLDEVINIILQKNYLFKIGIPGSALSHGKTTLAAAINNAGSLHDYFNNIIKANNPKTLLVELFSPNGSSYKDRGKHIIFLDQPQAVATEATSETNVANKATSMLNGLELQHQVKPTSMNANDQLNYAVLQVKHEMVTNQKNALEKEVNELRKKVDVLHEEKLALVKENTVSGERNKLEMEKAIFEAQKQQKEGLSGILEEVKENPDLLKMIAGFIKPDHPMFKESENQSMEGTKQIEAPRFHDNDEVNALLSDMPNTIKSMDPKLIAKIYYIFMEGFAKDPENVNKVFASLFPNAPQQ